jgi:hypothetical protein
MTTTGQREVQVGDDLVLLTAHYLIDMAASHSHSSSSSSSNSDASSDLDLSSSSAWTNTRAQRLRLEALELLEIGHRQSPHNFQMRLLLISLYGSLAAVPRTMVFFDLLEVKHIQLDTLTQLVIPAMRRHGFDDEAIGARWYKGVSSLARANGDGRRRSVCMQC